MRLPTLCVDSRGTLENLVIIPAQIDYQTCHLGEQYKVQTYLDDSLGSANFQDLTSTNGSVRERQLNDLIV
jgi:hypothetical protein